MARFIKAVCLSVLGLGLIPRAFPASSLDLSPRVEKTFSTQWLYVARDLADGEKPQLDDRGFERVSVPHANVLLPAETFDPDDFRFVSWYRKHFRPEDSWKGRLVTLRFQGVMTVADVYLNGKHLATHKGGYTPFDVDLTQGLQFGEDNVVAVRVDSRIQPHIPP